MRMARSEVPSARQVWLQRQSRCRQVIVSRRADRPSPRIAVVLEAGGECGLGPAGGSQFLQRIGDVVIVGAQIGLKLFQQAPQELGG